MIASVMGGSQESGSSNRVAVLFIAIFGCSTSEDDTLDAGGRPYIAPSARVRHWD
jgi:hypothetical protein